MGFVMRKVAFKISTLPIMALLAGAPAFAQTALAPPTIPEIKLIDRNLVDIVSGYAQFATPLVSIGPETAKFGETWVADKSEFVPFHPASRLTGGVSNNPGLSGGVIASFSGRGERFSVSNGIYTSMAQNGSTLVKDSNNIFIHTMSDGTIVRSDPAKIGVNNQNVAAIIDATMPDGRKLVFNYKSASYYRPSQGITVTTLRLQSITRNDGYQLRYIYAADAPGANGETIEDWIRVSQVTAVNGAVDYCDPLANSCSYSRSWPTATLAWVKPNGATNGSLTLTDAGGAVTRYRINEDYQPVGYKPPTSDTETATYEFCYKFKTPSNCYRINIGGGTSALAPGRALKVIVDGQTWNYTFHSGSGYEPSAFSGGGPVGRSINAVSQSHSGNLITATTADGTRHVFNLDINNRVNQSEHPDGRITSYTYDARGNVIQTRITAVSGSGLADIIRTANYDGTCSNLKTCNQPNWVRDELGNQMDITYEAQHGGMKAQTWPAKPNGIRPQVRHFYAQRHAWVKNSGGGYSQSADPIWVLTEQRWCKTGAASGDGCALAGDEVRRTFEYGPNAGPNNLMVRGLVEDAGGLSLRTCFKYDDYGNKVSETPPKAGLASCP